MLVEKKLSANDVAVIKLTSGEELIARVKEVKDGGINISKPLVLQPMQNPQTGQVSIGLAPWLFGVDPEQEVVIDSSKYVLATKAYKPAADMYTQQTSGIQTAGPADLSGIDLSNLGKR